MSCASAISTCSTRVLSLAVLVAGLFAMGYGFWMLDAEVNGFSLFVVIFGAYTALMGAVGTSVSCMETAKCTSWIFLFLVTLAVLVELAAGIALKANRTWAEDFFLGETCGNLNATHCAESVRQAEDYFESHEDMVFYILLGVIALQCCAGLSAWCFKRTHTGYESLAVDDDDAYIRHFDSMERGKAYDKEQPSPMRSEAAAPSPRSVFDRSKQVQKNQSMSDYQRKLREKYGVGTRSYNQRLSNASDTSDRGF